MDAAEAYIEEGLLRKLEAHASQAAAGNIEWMGLLLGRAMRWRGVDYAVIDDYATGANDATAVSVRFNESTFAGLAGRINECAGAGKLVVGWVHTHPGYGCFLSATDQKAQDSYFNSPFSVAMVMDPTMRDGGEMLYRFFKADHTNGKGYREASFAVYRKTQA